MTKRTEDQGKEELHIRNRNRERYELEAMALSFPDLKKYIGPSKNGNVSIDFSNSKAVKALNRAILFYYYGLENWNFPDENLCPPIPGRADYIHYMADLLATDNHGVIPRGSKVTCLDIGTGASCVYPIIGVLEYGWRFIGTDINLKSIQSVEGLIESNRSLKGQIDFKLQKNKEWIFRGILSKEQKIDLVICNPPFYSSLEEARKATARKDKNLTGKRKNHVQRNHAGIQEELIYEGGETEFIKKMIFESEGYAKRILWFSTLVSRESSLRKINSLFKKMRTTEMRTIRMSTGNKTSRIVIWTYLTEKERSIEMKKKFIK